MTKEDWDAISSVIDAIVLRFKEAELEIEKLKFRIEQLEKEKVK